MSEGLELLFPKQGQGDSESPADSGGPSNTGPSGERAGGEDTTALEHSSHFRAYQEEYPRGEVLPTGIRQLDEVLGGGLDFGLMTVAGAPTTGKTLLLEETGRSALLQNRTVVYAALQDGSLAAWQRLMARFSEDVAGLPLSLADLRARSLDQHASERLEELDARFAREILPRLILLDRLPPGNDGTQGLLDNIWWRVREAMERQQPFPLLLLDGLEAVNFQTARLHHGLQRLGVPGLATSGPLQSEAKVAGGGLLLLHEADDRAMGYEAQILLNVARNPRTGWQGRIQLKLDRSSGRLESPRLD
ncbi:MAG TPA: hypothetical protein VFE20_04745 [Thermoleophilia bacterium]|nr:hypothetical protein [Thermoleophilia bacterium]